MSLALPGFEECAAKGADIVLTPDDVAADVVRHFRPTGRILDPCKGEGAFLRHMPGAEWCEIREGRDFFAWRERVDWIVSNPPYSIFAPWMRHSFTIAEDIVYLIPIQKVFISSKMMAEVWKWGGVVEVYVIGEGKVLNWDIGFCIGAVHFRRGYRDGMRVEFRIPNAGLHRPSEAQHNQKG